MDFFTLIGVVALVFGILQIILFFKVWGMTNDVARIVEIMSRETRKETNATVSSSEKSAKEMSFEEFVDKQFAENPYFREYTLEHQRKLYDES